VTAALEKLKRLCVIAGAGAVFGVLAATANAAQCRAAFDKDGQPVAICGSVAPSVYAQYDDETDDEDDADDDEDEDDSRGFVYDEDEGSLMVDLENCEPGKYWMMDFEDGVPLPCPRR
jgi:uncharacterized membrane protein YebE (DUF533 family)